MRANEKNAVVMKGKKLTAEAVCSRNGISKKAFRWITERAASARRYGSDRSKHLNTGKGNHSAGHIGKHRKWNSVCKEQ